MLTSNVAPPQFSKLNKPAKLWETKGEMRAKSKVLTRVANRDWWASLKGEESEKDILYILPECGIGNHAARVLSNSFGECLCSLSNKYIPKTSGWFSINRSGRYTGRGALRWEGSGKRSKRA